MKLHTLILTGMTLCSGTAFAAPPSLLADAVERGAVSLGGLPVGT